MDKESIYELQKLDCNCNDCGYLIRDLDKFNKERIADEKNQLWFFRRKKARRIWNARKQKNPEKRKQALKDALSLNFKYLKQRSPVHYGNCSKFNKEVSFLSGVLQLETQHCFVHRKDLPVKNN